MIRERLPHLSKAYTVKSLYILIFPKSQCLQKLILFYFTEDGTETHTFSNWIHFTIQKSNVGIHAGVLPIP